MGEKKGWSSPSVIAVTISAASFVVAVASAIYSRDQASTARLALEASQERLAVELVRDNVGPIEASSTDLPLLPGGRSAPLAIGRWRATVTNTSNSATASVVGFEVWSQHSDGTRFSLPTNRVQEQGAAAPVERKRGFRTRLADA